jgi:hypothetical protein
MKEAWFKDSEGNILSIGEWSITRMQTAMSQKVGAGTGRTVDADFLRGNQM